MADDYNEDGYEEDDGNEEEGDFDYEEFYSKIKSKMNDEKVVKKIYNAKREIEHALECQIIISIPNISDEHQEDVFNTLNNMGIDPKTNTMKLGYLVDYLSSEDKELKVYIDALHIKPGVNPLTNLILVAMDDYVILVPKNEN
jgi:hypothetical protein